jgi:hypothetical protein
MAERDWKQEVEQNLEELELRQKSMLYNPKLARQSVQRGAAVALVVVLTWYGSSLQGISQEARYLFFACSIIGAVVATVSVAIGVNALVHQSKYRSEAPAPFAQKEPPAIGW